MSFNITLLLTLKINLYAMSTKYKTYIRKYDINADSRDKYESVMESTGDFSQVYVFYNSLHF